MKKIINVGKFQKIINDFARKRDWVQFHTPKNIASALAVEACELLEIFQWLTESQSFSIIKDKKKREAIEDELADVLVYCMRLADLLDIDLEKSIQRKIKKNGKKYPVRKVKGSSKKYDEY